MAAIFVFTYVPPTWSPHKYVSAVLTCKVRQLAEPSSAITVAHPCAKCMVGSEEWISWFVVSHQCHLWMWVQLLSCAWVGSNDANC